jgi:transketolase
MPCDPNQTDRIVRYIATQPGNFFVGMGRSKTPTITREDGSVFYDADYVFTPGKADWLRRGSDATIITYGAVTPACLEAWKILTDEGKSVGVLNMASLVPLDNEALLEAAAIGPMVTVEDHHVETGLGASAATVLVENNSNGRLQRLGVRHYGGSGKPADLYRQQGLDGASIAATVREMLS